MIAHELKLRIAIWGSRQSFIKKNNQLDYTKEATTIWICARKIADAEMILVVNEKDLRGSSIFLGRRLEGISARRVLKP